MAPPHRKQAPPPPAAPPTVPARPAFARPPLRERLRGWRPSVLEIAFTISIALHAAVLAVRIVDPQDFNRVFEDKPLEVVLVNARSKEAPTKAQAIAQARLAGGGETTGMSTSPLPPSPTVAVGDAQEDTHQRLEQLVEEQEQLLEQTRKALALLPVPDPRKRANMTSQERQQEEHRQQLLRQFAVIEKQIRQENDRPRRRYLSPATEEKVYALYMDSMRQRIEAHGTSHMPTQNGQKLHGSLYLNVVIAANGKVQEVKVKQGSGSRALDQRAAEIARSAGPFPPFTPEMRKQADEIEYTWRFEFTGTDGMTATPMANTGG